MSITMIIEGGRNGVLV